MSAIPSPRANAVFGVGQEIAIRSAAEATAEETTSKALRSRSFLTTDFTDFTDETQKTAGRGTLIFKDQAGSRPDGLARKDAKTRRSEEDNPDGLLSRRCAPR